MKRKLVGLDIVDERGPAEPRRAEVTSECLSPTLGKTLALGFVAPDVATGSLVRTDHRIARACALPFYDPDRRRPRAAPC
jgi:glycine cleavage system aminomethyltransferase T